MKHLPARCLALLALLALPLPAPAWDADCRHAAERRGSIDTAGARRVEIMARAGDLQVRPSRTSTLTAGGRACASSQKYLDQTLLHVRRVGDVVRVDVQMPEEMKGIGRLYATLDLAVEVPPGIPVDVTDSSGDMTLDGVQVATVRDSSGDIVAQRLAGDLTVEDSSGDIRIEDAAGTVSVTDSSGDIVIRGAAAVRIPVDSSGDIVVERVARDVSIERDSSGDIAVSGVGGDVQLLADGSGQVRVTAVRGEVRLP